MHYSNLLLSLDNFPNAKITDNNKFLNHFVSKVDAEKFVKAFNDFSNEINFQGFLSRFVLNTVLKFFKEEVTKEEFHF